MLSDIFQNLRHWGELDTAIALTAAVAALSCALPGVWLVLRRQSMLADALAHAALPGVVVAFLSAYAIKSTGTVGEAGFPALLHIAILAGAVAAGLATAWFTELIQRLGRIDNGAALGVVFTCLFAFGLLLLRLTADDVHLDPDCVLFGLLEVSALDTVGNVPWLPRAAVANAIVLGINLLLTLLFFKELRVSAFDPEMSRTQGIPAGVIQYTLLAATAIAAATAFSTVGSILVIGLLIVPAATAQLLSERLWGVILLSLLIAGGCAVLGHAVAMSAAAPVFSRLGFPQVRDVGTAGTIAVVAGVVFVLAVLFAPRTGVIMQVLDRGRIGLRIASDDILGALYRREESPGQPDLRLSWNDRLAGLLLLRRNLVDWDAARGYTLTADGRERAKSLVRSHRLWETYLDQNFPLPPDQLHLAADRAEHYLDPSLRDALAAEVPQTVRDPHGREIPEEKPPAGGNGGV